MSVIRNPDVVFSHDVTGTRISNLRVSRGIFILNSRTRLTLRRISHVIFRRMHFASTSFFRDFGHNLSMDVCSGCKICVTPLPFAASSSLYPSSSPYFSIGDTKFSLICSMRFCRKHVNCVYFLCHEILEEFVVQYEEHHEKILRQQ